MIVVIGKLIRSLRLDLKTKLPKKKKKAYVPPAVLARPRPRVSKEAAARVKPVQVEEEPEYDEAALGRRREPVPALTPPAYVPPPPKRLDLDGARPVVPWTEGTGLADRRAARSARRIPAVPPARRPHRHGRRGER